MRLTATAVAFSKPAGAGENPQGFKLWDRSCTEKLPRAKALQFLCLTCALNHRFRQVIKKRCLKKHHPKSQHGLVCKPAVCPVVLFRDRMVTNCLVFARSAALRKAVRRKAYSTRWRGKNQARQSGCIPRKTQKNTEKPVLPLTKRAEVTKIKQYLNISR